MSSSPAPKDDGLPPPELKGFGLQLLDQIQNEGAVHTEVVRRIEEHTKRNLICYSSFFQHPAGIILDDDARIIETLLHSIDLAKYPDTLDLMINSPGGSPTAAEKIVLTCRHYAKSFRVLVAQTAMSAATIVALGADTILMMPTAELGPIDPQMIQTLPNGSQVVRPAKAFIDAYLKLVNKTQTAIKNREPPHPYIELLRTVDPSWIQVCLKARKLAKSIAIEFLKTWMLHDTELDEVKAVVERFVKEGEEGSHGRAIRLQKAKAFGVAQIEMIEQTNPLWRAVWELNERCHRYVQSRCLAKYVVARTGAINMKAEILRIN